MATENIVNHVQKWYIYYTDILGGIGNMKITKVIISILLIFSLIGCANKDKEELINYVNNNLPSISQKESEILGKYDPLTKDGVIDEEEYVVLVQEILPAYGNVISDLEKISLQYQDLRDVHEFYIKAINLQHSSFIILASAIQNNDFKKLSESTEKFSESRKYSRDATHKLRLLCEKHNVEYENLFKDLE